MPGGVFVLTGDDLIKLREQPYASEDLLQALLAKHPDLLAGDQLGAERRRWLLVKREAGVPGHEAGGDRWAIDHLFLDQEAIPTLVEAKRSEDTRIRREVVGQMLDYAANGIVYWPVERLRADFEVRCGRENLDPNSAFAEAMGEDRDQDEFWAEVEQNLRSGRVRLVFVADEIPSELRRVIEFLNGQMSPCEVIGIEIRQYVGDGGLKTLVPRVVGQTERARAQKLTASSGDATLEWDEYKERLTEDQYAIARELYERIEASLARRGLPWEGVLRSTWFVFKRPGGYSVVGADVSRGKPVQFWVKLPRDPQELRRQGHQADDPYPELVSGWSQWNNQWFWNIPALEALPDVDLAIELTAHYQPESGPMQEPRASG